MTREGVLFVYGNPLLDISADVNEEFLKKYDLEPNNAILAEDKHKVMYDDLVANFNVDFTPGGAAQNTARVAQWLIAIPKSVSYVGCIGNDDKYGKILEQKAEIAGVCARYMKTDKEPTGTCAVLVTDSGKNRSLCAYLAAANHYKSDHLETPEVDKLMRLAQYYYISGFPLTVSPESMLHIAKHAANENKKFIMNLSAPFLCEVFKQQMNDIMPYVDVLFGNETETDIDKIAMKIASWPKQNGRYGRIVVITHGSEPTIVVDNGVLKKYPVIHIEDSHIVDTNGAGDAFVGGFLARFVQGEEIEACIRGGNYAANLIIQRPGCSLPEKPDCTVSVF
ncbi:DgyrCDS3354 [Dimorphilus gyrociliatus]|uniref:Adenosine kinase n=1 Tax=Dimorphilus gyrociliatus TaxID=2664684 RepID=A0A7I8VFM9_9ANNE|nr:DgyrCDS3354 [Dimorphilus gyrociliatus]